ncbi:hypothetical protein AAG570_013152 [Ranatra chinensis]|uniref:Uncharacterized protein n=1 Tax=Ranatra chinensis TaxID=642074 RepID=A0ABD0Z477_9HEMI
MRGVAGWGGVGGRREDDCGPRRPQSAPSGARPDIPAMAEYKFGVNSSAGAVSSVEFAVASLPASAGPLYYQERAPPPPQQVRDDKGADETTGKGRAGAQQGETDGDGAPDKEEEGAGPDGDEPGGERVGGGPARGPGGGALRPGPHYEPPVDPSERGGGLWPPGPDDDPVLPAVNGSLAFQNFPAAADPYGGGPAQSQRRPPPPGAHNFPRHVQQQQQGVFVAAPGKGYASWSGPQQSGWPAAPQSQPGLAAALSPWTRGRSAPNLNPLQTGAARKAGPPFAQHSGGMLVSPKFRRSTSYPGKVFPQPPPFEIGNIDENRPDLLLPYQVTRPPPLRPSTHLPPAALTIAAPGCHPSPPRPPPIRVPPPPAPYRSHPRSGPLVPAPPPPPPPHLSCLPKSVPFA